MAKDDTSTHIVVELSIDYPDKLFEFEISTKDFLHLLAILLSYLHVMFNLYVDEHIVMHFQCYQNGFFFVLGIEILTNTQFKWKTVANIHVSNNNINGFDNTNRSLDFIVK